MRVQWSVMKFSVSKDGVWGAAGNVGVATGPQRDAPRLSNSLLNNPLWVNDPFRTGVRKQP